MRTLRYLTFPEAILFYVFHESVGLFEDCLRGSGSALVELVGQDHSLFRIGVGQRSA